MAVLLSKDYIVNLNPTQIRSPKVEHARPKYFLVSRYSSLAMQETYPKKIEFFGGLVFYPFQTPSYVIVGVHSSLFKHCVII